MTKQWQLLQPPPASFYDTHPNLPPIVATLLHHRNITTPEAIDEFLNPDYSKHIYDPFLFRDMRKAVDRIFHAIEKNEKIVIHGDYDADGVSASVILTDLFKALGHANFEVFLPHRETDGYGLNTNTVQILAEQGTKLIITCDCGISNAPEVALANEKGIDVIITDHHSIPETLPAAYAIIHPKIAGETYPDKGLAGGGVAFKLMQAMLKTHKERGGTTTSGKSHEAVEKWTLDMAAIASVADMVPLLGESRTLTTYGLIVLNKTKRIGLQKLLLEARLMDNDGIIKREIDADTIGFHIAPRINAAGRMNHASVGYKLLSTEDPTEAVDLAFELNQNNQERQKFTDQYVKEAIAQVKAQDKSPFIFVASHDWFTGIVGLIASRIKDKYGKPTIAFAYQNGSMVGSGRSVEGFDLIGALQQMPHFFLKFGGHPMACGFTLASPDVLDAFKTALTQKFVERTALIDTTPTVQIDAEIELEQVDWELYAILEKFKPFGQANPKPKYCARSLTIRGIEPVGQDGKHLRLMVSHTTPRIRKMMGWRLCNGDAINWCKALKKGDTIDAIFEIDINEWNGNRELQMTIVDLKRADHTDDADSYADDANHADSKEDETNLIYADLTYKINGVLFQVHNKLGNHCNEKQISDAIEEALKQEGIPYEREKILPESFEGERFGRNKIDFLIEDKIILEIKVRNFVGKEEYYQCLRYLEAYDKKLCLLVNFRTKYLKVKRVLNPKAKI